MIYAARSLNAQGQCCGRKPLVYKRPTHFLFCCRCDTAYDPSGKQIQNWAWKTAPGGFTPEFPNSEYVKAATPLDATSDTGRAAEGGGT